MRWVGLSAGRAPSASREAAALPRCARSRRKRRRRRAVRVDPRAALLLRVWLAGWWVPCRGGLGCSLLAVPPQVRERPLSSLGPRRAAGSAAAAVRPPIRVLLSLLLVRVWLALVGALSVWLVCSLLAVPPQVCERPLSLLGPRRAAGSAAAAVGPPVVPIRVLLSLLLVWVWLAGGGPVGVGWSARCSQFQFGAPSGEWVGWGALQMRSGAPGHPSKDTCGLIGSASARSPAGGQVAAFLSVSVLRILELQPRNQVHPKSNDALLASGAIPCP